MSPNASMLFPITVLLVLPFDADVEARVPRDPVSVIRIRGSETGSGKVIDAGYQLSVSSIRTGVVKQGRRTTQTRRLPLSVSSIRTGVVKPCPGGAGTVIVVLSVSSIRTGVVKRALRRDVRLLALFQCPLSGPG